MRLHHIFVCIAGIILMAAIVYGRLYCTDDMFALPPTQSSTISTSSNISSSSVSNTSSNTTITSTTSLTTPAMMKPAVPAAPTMPAPVVMKPAAPTMPAPTVMKPAAPAAPEPIVAYTIETLPLNVSEPAFARILAAYKQSLAQFKLALDDFVNLNAQNKKDTARLQNDMNAIYLTIDWMEGITKEQQVQIEAIQEQMDVNNAMIEARSKKVMDALPKALMAVPVAQKLLGAANARRAPMPNTTVPVKVSSIPAQTEILPTKTQPPLFLTNTGVWSSAEFVRPRGYIAATCFEEQTFKLVKPILLDTLLTVVGSTISIQNTPTESTFILASGYMYKCRAEINIVDGLAYIWFINGAPFGSVGYAKKDGGSLASTTYIKNDTSEPMLATLMCLGDTTMRSMAMAGINMGSLVEITEIATI